MTRFGLHTVQRRLIVVVLATTLTALVVALVAVVGDNLRGYRNGLVADMATQSELLGHMTEPALNFDDRHLAEQNLNLLRYRPKVMAAAIYDAKGHVFATYGKVKDVLLPKHPEHGEISRVEGDSLVVFRPIASNGELVGTVYLRTDYDFRQRVLAYVGIAVAATCVAMVVAFVMLIRLQRVVIQPIRDIAGVAREVVTQRDYTRRAKKTSGDEVGTLVDAFNDMLAEIERRTQELERSNQDIAREVSDRRLAQAEVMRLNEQLEDRVRERTAQLETMNAELIQAKAAADNANQAKSAFLSSMSHDLRTPLNAILGFTQLLIAQASTLTVDSINEYTSYILKAGEHLLTLINEVLDLAKIESGTVSLSMESVALSGLFSECRDLVQPLADRRAIRLVFECDETMHVTADRIRLKQVLLNLISNAIKYNRDAGMVTVACTEQLNGKTAITVRDTGQGLSAAQIGQLFQPFNRLGQEASTIEGTGIGLVVTKRLAELMSGEISVESVVGIGSTFRVLLTTANASNYEPDGPAVAPMSMQTGTGDLVRTILYVEDNPVNLKLVEAIFSERHDVRLLSAADANFGITLARAHQPTAILMDINLPGLSGSEALRVLQQDAATAHIPVIALTANAMQKDIDKGLAQGFFRYLTKPIKIKELLDTIDLAIAEADARRVRGAAGTVS